MYADSNNSALCWKRRHKPRTKRGRIKLSIRLTKLIIKNKVKNKYKITNVLSVASIAGTLTTIIINVPRLYLFISRVVVEAIY